MKISADEYKAISEGSKGKRLSSSDLAKIVRSKASYIRNTVKIESQGVQFASKLEFERYKMLLLRLRAGEIEGLIYQPEPYLLQPKFETWTGEKVRSITYQPDFFYIEAGKKVVEETKGFLTQPNQLRIKMFKYLYRDIEHRLIRREKQHKKAARE